MSNDILFFHEVKENHLNLVGGKALNLGKMIKAKFPVPEGFCVTTIAFNDFINFIYKEEVFKQLINTNFEDINKIDKLCMEIRELITSKSLPSNLKEIVKDAVKKIGESDYYAIRSSATAEDLPNMSFAGQQDTYLNIKGIEDIYTHIKMCWASLYTQRAAIYRKKNNLDEKDISISVVVQKIVNSKKSGIMFTANPFNNNYNEISIDAGYGLGEALVSGLVVPDSYQYDKQLNNIVSTTVNTKELAIYRKDGGGTTTVTLDKNMQTNQVLSVKEIKDIANMGSKIEEYYQYPQDIEWAIDEEDKLYILQSRPITSLYPKLEDINSKEEKIYISFNHIQVMTNPMKPLGIDMIQRIFPYKQDKDTHKSLAVKKAGGRIYIDVTNLYSLPMRNKLLELSVKNIDYLMGNAVENYLSKGKLNKKLPTMKAVSSFRKNVLGIMKIGVRNINNNIKIDAVSELNMFIDEYVRSLREAFEKKQDLLEKLEFIRVHAPTFFMLLLKRVVPFMIPAIVSYKSLEKLLQKNNIDTTLVNRLIGGLEGNVTTEMGLRVGDLSDCVREKEDIIKILENNPKNAHKLILREHYTELNQCLNEFLNEYGMRGMGEIDITSPRYDDDFSTISMSIINNIKNTSEKEHRKNYANLIEESKVCEEKILKALKDKNSKEINKAKNYIANIRSYLPIREHGKHAIIRTFDIYRKVIYNCGEKLTSYGLINYKDDVSYLTLDEIIKAVNNKVSYKEEINKRKEEYKYYYTLTPPRVIDNNGQIYFGSYKTDNLPKDALAATPASAGVYEGYARVILDPTKENLKKGEILVTKFTDPGWTPFFINAKGLILEVGGIMTHGATVAREYGIPALVGLENATSLIKTGDYIRINADKGYLEILTK